MLSQPIQCIFLTLHRQVSHTKHSTQAINLMCVWLFIRHGRSVLKKPILPPQHHVAEHLLEQCFSGLCAPGFLAVRCRALYGRCEHTSRSLVPGHGFHACCWLVCAFHRAPPVAINAHRSSKLAQLCAPAGAGGPSLCAATRGVTRSSFS